MLEGSGGMSPPSFIFFDIDGYLNSFSPDKTDVSFENLLVEISIEKASQSSVLALAKGEDPIIHSATGRTALSSEPWSDLQDAFDECFHLNLNLDVCEYTSYPSGFEAEEAYFAEILSHYHRYVRELEGSSMIGSEKVIFK